MDDNFWDEIDAMLHAKDNEEPIVSPFAAPAVQAASIPNIMDDTITFAPMPLPPQPQPTPPMIPTPMQMQTQIATCESGVLATSMSIQVDTLRQDLRALVNKCGSRVSFARFKREACKAFLRRNPGAKPPMNAFQAFIKEKIKGVRQENPTAGHSEHMKIIGRLWRESDRGRGNRG
jgi:hypothetical protein